MEGSRDGFVARLRIRLSSTLTVASRSVGDPYGSRDRTFPQPITTHLVGLRLRRWNPETGRQAGCKWRRRRRRPPAPYVSKSNARSFNRATSLSIVFGLYLGCTMTRSTYNNNRKITLVVSRIALHPVKSVWNGGTAGEMYVQLLRIYDLNTGENRFYGDRLRHVSLRYSTIRRPRRTLTSNSSPSSANKLCSISLP